MIQIAVLLALCTIAYTAAEGPVIPVLRIIIHVDEQDRELFRTSESLYMPESVWEARHGPLTEIDRTQLQRQRYLREYIRWCNFPL
jgi:hypothetical protein